MDLAVEDPQAAHWQRRDAILTDCEWSFGYKSVFTHKGIHCFTDNYAVFHINKMFSCINNTPKWCIVFFFTINKILFSTLDKHRIYPCFLQVSLTFYLSLGHGCALLLSRFRSCLTLCDPMDGSPPGSSVHGILQARILEWAAMSSSRGPSRSRDRTRVSYSSSPGRRVLYQYCHLAYGQFRRKHNYFLFIFWKTSFIPEDFWLNLLSEGENEVTHEPTVGTTGTKGLQSAAPL